MRLTVTLRRRQGGAWSDIKGVPVQPAEDRYSDSRLIIGEWMETRGSGLSRHILSVDYDDIPELIVALAQALADKTARERAAS